MKRCPTCDKTFADGMKFCQTDGTLLIEDAPPADPYKTVVGNQSDIASAIPPLDPFKTMVAPPPKANDDILELPGEQDSLKTMVVSQDEMKEALKPTAPKPGGAVPIIEPKPASSPSDFSPPPPKFNEPSLSPPSFGDLSPKDSGVPKPTDAAPSFENKPSPFDSKSKPNDFSTQSPYGNQENKPIPSPFDGSMVGYQPPAAPPPFESPKPPVKEPEPTFGGQQESFGQSPFQPPTPFGQNEPFNAPMQQNEWTPPPVPNADWGNQDLGANISPVAAGGENKTLAIVSLVLGIFSFLCGGIFLAIPAIITGYMQKNNIKKQPAEYGGATMATIGMILGAVNVLLTVVILVIYVILIIASR